MTKPKPLPLRPKHFGSGSAEVESGKPDEGPIRRLSITAGNLVERPAEGVDTTSDIIAYAAKQYGKEKAVGWIMARRCQGPRRTERDQEDTRWKGGY